MIVSEMEIFKPNKGWISRIVILTGTNKIVPDEMDRLKKIQCKWVFYLGCVVVLIFNTK